MIEAVRGRSPDEQARNQGQRVDREQSGFRVMVTDDQAAGRVFIDDINALAQDCGCPTPPSNNPSNS
jgi:hypothetical protein